MLKKRDKLLSIVNSIWVKTFGNYPTLTKSLLKHFLFTAVWAYFFYQLELKLDDESIKSIISSMQNITAAVFALSAVWIAIGYPEAIKAYVNPDKFSLVKGATNTIRIEKLVNIILPTTFVLTFTFLLQWIDVLINAIFASLGDYASYYMASKYAFIFYLSVLIIQSLWQVMTVNMNMANELHDKKDSSELNDRLMK